MAVYNYPAPRAPEYKRPTRVEECLPRARALVKMDEGFSTLGPVEKGDQILIVTEPDQDECVREAISQALREAGAKKVSFITPEELTGEKPQPGTAEEAWTEVDLLREGNGPGASVAHEVAAALRNYFDQHPEYTGLRWGPGGGVLLMRQLGEHASKYRGLYVFHNWEAFVSRASTYPSELVRAIERKIVEPLGKASAVRFTDPQGTHIEYSLTPEQARRWQMGANYPDHLFMDPLQATAEEISGKAEVPPIFPNLNGVLAGTANHCGFFPHIELYFQQGRLVEVKGGGKYGEEIREMMDRYRDVQWPGWPGKGYFWFCDCALCTQVKAFRRKSDMFQCYTQGLANIPERMRAGVIHSGFGTRVHGEAMRKYIKENSLPTGHIHVHTYFPTYEIKLEGTDYWYKIVDKGWITAMSDPDIRALACQYGDPDELLSYDWIPPLPGINSEGNYWQDYAPDPMKYLKTRIKEGKSV
jgi:hypothetical protein